MAKDQSKKDNKDEEPTTSKGASGKTESNGIWQDSRFQHLLTTFDPRFKNLPKNQRKVKIDKRFQSMFTDKKFKIKYTVDKYGRRVNQSTSEDLKKYYELDSNEESDGSEDEEQAKEVDTEDEEIEEEQRKEEKAISGQIEEKDGKYEDRVKSDNDELCSDGEEVPKTLRERLFDPHIDYARGEGRIITDSSSDDDSTDEGEDDDTYMAHTWGELDAEAERSDEATYRLAVCNMDWDRIRAEDLMVLLSSFLPPGGSVLSVKIYTSEYGKERLEAEERYGPPELVGLGKEVMSENGKSNDINESDSEDDIVQEQDSDAEEGDTYHMEKLRQYQLNRLRYYYAVVECDSIAAADKIYAECDGLEYESSATRVDLRFIPDDITFEDEPTDVCLELPDTNSYQPRLFTNTALQQAKVDLTWDETAVDRRELNEKLQTGKLEEINDKDLRKYVAYSSEEESESDKEKEPNSTQENLTEKNEPAEEKIKVKKPKKDNYLDKYKALLSEINEKEEQEKSKKFELEYSWKINAFDDSDNDEKDLGIVEKPNSELTPIEKVLKKRSEKNKQRKLERKRKMLLAQGLDPDAAGNDSDSDGLPDGIDMSDPYFAEEFANGDFVDPKAKKRDLKKKLKQEIAQEKEDEERQAKELELLLDDDDEEQKGKQHFSLDKILKSEKDVNSKRKRRKQLKLSKEEILARSKQVEDNFKINLDDERFKAVYSHPLFNIDPTHSHFKKTKNMELLVHEKLKRRHGTSWNGNDRKEEVEYENSSKKPKKLLEQTLLVKSLKRKLQGNKS